MDRKCSKQSRFKLAATVTQLSFLSKLNGAFGILFV